VIILSSTTTLEGRIAHHLLLLEQELLLLLLLQHSLLEYLLKLELNFLRDDWNWFAILIEVWFSFFSFERVIGSVLQELDDLFG
jgi:hypothetical protein